MYWNKKFPFTVKYPSQVGTNWDTANLKDTKFDKTALEFVGHQFPGGSSVSPYTDELVILENGVNSRKEQVSLLHPLPRDNSNTKSCGWAIIYRHSLLFCKMGRSATKTKGIG
jgi:hypothetical protein